MLDSLYLILQHMLAIHHVGEIYIFYRVLNQAKGASSQVIRSSATLQLQDILQLV